MHETHNVSVSNHLRWLKKAGWICPPTWKLNFICLLITIDYTSAPQFCQAALRVPELTLTAKVFKKIYIIETFSFIWTNLKKIF